MNRINGNELVSVHGFGQRWLRAPGRPDPQLPGLQQLVSCLHGLHRVAATTPIKPLCSSKVSRKSQKSNICRTGKIILSKILKGSFIRCACWDKFLRVRRYQTLGKYKARTRQWSACYLMNSLALNKRHMASSSTNTKFRSGWTCNDAQFNTSQNILKRNDLLN